MAQKILLNPDCPGCKTSETRLIGKIPSNNCFGGRRLEVFMDGGNLYKCNACNLYYRHPHYDEEDFIPLYELTIPEMWQSDWEKRVDWQLANSFILKASDREAKLLDVGCWRGDFLKQYVGSMHTYAVEANAAAASEAASCKINVIGKSYRDLVNFPEHFDIITAFDIIEHVENPFLLLGILTQSLRKEGLIIISTGNTDSPIWKILGSKYWYCNFIEHLSFINFPWCIYASRKIGLAIETCIKFSHGTRSPQKILKEVLCSLLYLLSSRGYFRLKKIATGEDAMIENVPGLTTAKDHMLVVFRKL